MYVFRYIFIVFLELEVIWAEFFHEPSRIVFEPRENYTQDFGYSIAYFKENLIVGAPHATLNGVVYMCPLNNTHNQTNIVCSDSNIDVEKYAADYDRVHYPNQPFCLGGSIAVTKNYFVTCSPLWTKSQKPIASTGPSVQGAFGTCFKSTGNTTERYQGLLEYYDDLSRHNYSDVFVEDKPRPMLDDIYGAFGWNSIVDEVNNIMVFAKPSDLPPSRFSYKSISEDESISFLSLDKTFIGEQGFKYQGKAFASGRFFKNFNNLIAFSMENDAREGAIGFLKYNSSTHKLSLVEHEFRNRMRPVVIRIKSVGSMFGASLEAADVTKDNYTELFVGAPAQVPGYGFDIGAVHIYVGGGIAERKSESNLCIFGKEDGSRFGSTIASTDLDYDGISEIFISAPYEGFGTGTLYVLSGRELLETLKVKKSLKNPTINIKEFLRKQEIKSDNFKAFGYSISIIPSFYETQLNGVAVGSPDSQRVILYRSIPTITVDVKVMMKDEVVHESDKVFNLTVNIHVTYPKNINITAKLLLKVSLFSYVFADIEGSKEYEIDLSPMAPIYPVNIVVKMKDNDPHTYKFKAEVMLLEDISKKKDYDSSLVRLHQMSKLSVVHDITRTCDDTLCMPRLSAKFKFSHGNGTYLLGSSKTAVMSVIIVNEGNMSDVSCAWIHLKGAPVSLLKCDQSEDSWYKCDLSIDRHAQRSIDIELDMTKVTSQATELRTDVKLYNHCPMTVASKSEYDVAPYIIRYVLNEDDIQLYRIGQSKNITATILESSVSVEITSLFLVKNTGKVLWEHLKAEIITQKEEYLELFEVQSSDCENCNISKTSDIQYEMSFDMKPNSTTKIILSTTFFKDEIKKHLKNNRLVLNTTLRLKLKDDFEVKNVTVSTILMYRSDVSLGQNMTAIIIASCIIGICLLMFIVFLLIRFGFFKREKKQKLERLRSSIRRPPSERNEMDMKELKEILKTKRQSINTEQ